MLFYFLFISVDFHLISKLPEYFTVCISLFMSCHSFIHSYFLFFFLFFLQRIIALKNVSAKVTLAIRIDSYQNSTDFTEGAKLRRDLEDKLEKLQEPAKAKTKKALPIPEEKKRRIGSKNE